MENGWRVDDGVIRKQCGHVNLMLSLSNSQAVDAARTEKSFMKLKKRLSIGHLLSVSWQKSD